MSRRKPYTKVQKNNQIRADHVKGMGDVVFKGFQCLNSECEEFLFVRREDLGDEFEIICPSCGFVIRTGEETKFYDYKLKDLKARKIIEKGEFTILHDDYIDEAQEYKYCIICNTMKPLEFFDQHSARASKHQGECRLCKAVYNAIKNRTRLTDQHREAAQKRRLYVEFSGSQTIDSKEIFTRFGYKCFKCGINLKDVARQERALDHTLPAVYLWPLTTDNATLLCKRHNAEKAEKWPGQYYDKKKLKRLSVMTGISYDILSGTPCYNPEAIKLLESKEHVDALLIKFGAYMPEIIKLRNRILLRKGFDFFENSSTISSAWICKANNEFERIARLKKNTNKVTDTDEK